MNSVFVAAVVFGGVVIALAIVCGTILMAIKLRHGGIYSQNRQEQAEEARMIQEIYHGLSKLEDRLEALETILMDRQRKD